MVWTVQNQRNDEASKIRWELVPYMYGTALDIGCGGYKVFPHFTGVDNGHHWGRQNESVHVETAEKLTLFASQSVDCAFSSHLLEHLEDWKGALRDWWRVLKPGGYLCLYLPHKDFYPHCSKRSEWEQWWAKNKQRHKFIDTGIEELAETRVKAGAKTLGEKYAGTPYANQDHRQDFYPQDVIDFMEELGGWDLLVNEERNEGDEYSFWQVFQKAKNGKQTQHSWKNPKTAKTAAVVRYGAIGDMIQTSSIFPALKEQGYHVTLYCQAGQGHESIKHDPNIDRIIVQGKDHVPNQFLEEFFSYEKKKYSKWINLCEAVEGTLLASPGRASYDWPNEVRALHMDRNYLEWMHKIAEVPPVFRPKFYSHIDERVWAQKQKANFGRKNVLWSLAGSSGHKVWPHIDAIIARVMLSWNDVHVVLVGDHLCKVLEEGWCRYDEEKDDFLEVEPRVHLRSGKWSIRQSMAFAEVADLIIGTETGLLNAAGGMETAKIINLSHSSEEMLTKHWKRVFPLHQLEGTGCKKHPCRQLHGASQYDPWMDCPQHQETGTSLCQYNITVEQMWEKVREVIGAPQRMAA